MRNFTILLLVIALVLPLSSCTITTEKDSSLTKEGIAPYKMTESDEKLLQALNLTNDVSIIEFTAPKEAITVEVNIYILEAGDEWENMGGGMISLGTDASPTARLEGSLALLLRGDYGIDMNINTKGIATYQIKPLDIDFPIMASSKGFLREFQKIELDQEIPIAILVYSSKTSMTPYTLESYFTPSDFEGIDLVQAITVTFSKETT